MDHSDTEARCSDARCSRRRHRGSRESSTSRRSRCSGRRDLTCGRDRDRRKEGLADPVSRMDLEIPGPGLPERCLQSVAARKAWPENRLRVGVRKAWMWQRRHAEALMGWQRCRYPGHHRGSAQMERPSAGS